MTRVLDGMKLESFTRHLLGAFNGGSVALMTSVGHRVGLFDTMARLPEATSQEIAEAARLDRRYVEGWLDVMAVGGVVEHNPDRQTFRLPAEHAASVTRAAGMRNLATYAQLLPLLGSVEDELLRGFRGDAESAGGASDRLLKLLADESRQLLGGTLLRSTLALVGGLPERLQAGAVGLDLACGHGHLLNLMAAAFPRSRFLGLDTSPEAAAAARADAQDLGLPNVRFEVHSLEELTAFEEFDLVTAFSGLRALADPASALPFIFNALRGEGALLMVDVAASSELRRNMGHPLAPFVYALSCFHLLGTAANGSSPHGPPLWGEEAVRRALLEAGFATVQVRRLDGDLLNNYYVAHKG